MTGKDTHVGKGEGVSVGVDNWHDVEVNVGEDVIVCGGVGEQLVDHVGDGGGGDPLTGVDT